MRALILKAAKVLSESSPEGQDSLSEALRRGMTPEELITLRGAFLSTILNSLTVGDLIDIGEMIPR